MTNDDYPTGLATTKRDNKSFGQRLASRITVGHLLLAGVLAGFGAGFGTHALVQTATASEGCPHAPVVTDIDVGDGVPALGVVVNGGSERWHHRGHREHRCHRHRHGVHVTRVVADSPASDAGLEEGDIIVAIDGADIRSSRHLVRSLQSRDIGEGVTLHVHRDDERLDLHATLAAFRSIYED